MDTQAVTRVHVRDRSPVRGERNVPSPLREASFRSLAVDCEFDSPTMESSTCKFVSQPEDELTFGEDNTGGYCAAVRTVG